MNLCPQIFIGEICGYFSIIVFTLKDWNQIWTEKITYELIGNTPIQTRFGREDLDPIIWVSRNNRLQDRNEFSISHPLPAIKEVEFPVFDSIDVKFQAP